MPTYDENGALLVNLAGSIAPVGAQYVVMALDATLTNERVLTGTANQVIVTDGGAGGPATLSTPQDIAPASGVTFGTVTVPNAGWVGAGVGCAWLYDSATPDISTAVDVGVGTTAPNPTASHTRNLTIATATHSPGLALWTENDALNSHTIGIVDWVAGSGTKTVVSRIKAQVLSTNEDSGRMSFYTKKTGVALTLAMHIDVDQQIGIGTATPGSLMEWNFATEDLEFVDAGSAAATEQDWIEVQVGGVTGYIRVFAAK